MELRPIKANMNVVSIKEGLDVLFSYKTPVAAVIDGCAYRTSHKWSVTTTRHINKWFAMGDITSSDERPQEFFDSLLAEVK